MYFENYVDYACAGRHLLDFNWLDVVATMTEQEKWEVRQRAIETIARLDAQRERWEQERSERAEGVEWPAPPSEPQEPDPAIVHPLTRPPRARDWDSEARWVGSICDRKIAALRTEITEAVGEVIARERALWRQELAAAIASAKIENCETYARRIDALLLRLVGPPDDKAALLGSDGTPLRH
jgi:hypothetical protein